jgi:hypothetical protein
MNGHIVRSRIVSDFLGCITGIGAKAFSNLQQYMIEQTALVGDYYPPYDDTDELIAAVRDAINSGNRGTINTLAGQFDYWNNGIHEFPE